MARRVNAVGPLALAGVYAVVAFAAEPALGFDGQAALGVGAWLLLLAAARSAGRRDRARVAAVIVVATAGEALFSLWLGVFTYRWHNIPAYVPPGHGLILLASLRMARGVGAARARLVAIAALGTALAWAAVGLLLDPRPDALGAIGLAVLTLFLARGRRPLLYACVFFVAGPLELYATSVGTWHWARIAPLLRIPAANPPCAIPAGYILFDALGLRLLSLARRARRFHQAAPQLYARRGAAVEGRQ
jgi:hypothetical protein